MNSLRRETWLSLAMVLATVGCTASRGRPLAEPKVELAGQAAESHPPPKLFPRSGPHRDLQLDGFALPVPADWKVEVYDETDDAVAFATVAAPGKACDNHVWFDLVPSVSLEYAKRLIDTESMWVTRAVRQWAERAYSPIRLAAHDAVVRRFPSGHLSVRTVYLLPGGGGVLIAQVMSQKDNPHDCVSLHDGIADVLAAAFYSRAVIGRVEQLSKSVKPPPLEEVTPVPASLEECFEPLKKAFRSEDLEKFSSTPEDSVVGAYHFSAGMWIRNRWGLWGESPLYQSFSSKGVFHPDDVSAIILLSFWRHLHGKPLEVDTQIARIKRDWDDQRKGSPEAEPTPPKGQ